MVLNMQNQWPPYLIRTKWVPGFGSGDSISALVPWGGGVGRDTLGNLWTMEQDQFLSWGAPPERSKEEEFLCSCLLLGLHPGGSFPQASPADGRFFLSLPCHWASRTGLPVPHRDWVRSSSSQNTSLAIVLSFLKFMLPDTVQSIFWKHRSPLYAPWLNDLQEHPRDFLPQCWVSNRPSQGSSCLKADPRSIPCSSSCGLPVTGHNLPSPNPTFTPRSDQSPTFSTNFSLPVLTHKGVLAQNSHYW